MQVAELVPHVHPPASALLHGAQRVVTAPGVTPVLQPRRAAPGAMPLRPLLGSEIEKLLEAGAVDPQGEYLCGVDAEAVPRAPSRVDQFLAEATVGSALNVLAQAAHDVMAMA